MNISNQIKYGIAVSLFLLSLFYPAVAQCKAEINGSGLGIIKQKSIQLTVTENGLVSIMNANEEICGPMSYQLVDSNYKQLLSSARDIVSKSKLKLKNSTITAEQVIEGETARIRCKQQISLDANAILTIVYTVFPEKWASDINFKQQRVVLELKDKQLSNKIELIESSGQHVFLDKFSSSEINPKQYTFHRLNNQRWNFSVTPVRGTSKILVQLYSSYSKFIKTAVFNRNTFSLKMQLDLSNLTGSVLSPKPVVNIAPPVYELQDKDLKNIPSGKTNLLANGSFEFGMNGWKTEWTAVGNSKIWDIITRDDKSSFMKYTGKKLRGVKLMSYPYARNGEKNFTVSADLKGTTEGQTVMLGLSAAPVLVPKRSQYFLWKKFKLTKNWENYSATFRIPKHWVMDNICFMVGPEKEGIPFEIDNAQLYPGKSPGKTSIKEKFGIVLKTGKNGNIFIKNQTASVKARIINGFKEKNNFKIKIDKVDFWGKTETLMNDSYSISANGIKEFTLPVSTENRGYFTLKYQLEDQNGNLKSGSMVYCVITDNSSLDRSKFGINFHMERPFEDQVDIALGLLAKAGFGSVRAWWDWGIVEGNRGSFNWTKPDSQVKLCKKHNLEIVPTILRMYGPGWTVPARFQTPPDDLSLWDNYVEKAVNRYKGQVKYWEVWNEPDVSPGLKYKPELYLDILKRTYKNIKRIDPKAKVIGICGSHSWFFDAILRTGGTKYLDIISYHSYYYKYNPEVALIQWDEKFKKELGKYNNGKNIPIWNTEVGIADGRGGHIESEENNIRSCGILVRNFVSSFACGTERVYWFTASLISLYAHSLFDNQFIPTPAMIAFNAMSEQLAGSEYAGRVKRDNDNGFFCFTFKQKDNTSLAVIWFNGLPATKQIKFENNDKLTVLDIMGNPVKPENGAYNMASSFPLYIKAENKAALVSQIQGIEFIDTKLSEKPSIKTGEVKQAKPSIGPFKPTKDGMIIDWNIFGPFANPGGRGYDQGLDIDYLKPFGGETNANLNMNSSCSYTWPKDMKHYLQGMPEKLTIKSKEYHGAAVADYYGEKTYIDLRNILKPEKFVVGYAFCYIDSPETMKVKLKIGSDDGCKIFLNHKKIWRNKIYRKAEIDNDVITAELHKGLNSLLVKVSQDGGGWGFYLRITDSNDKVVKNIKIWL